MPTWTPPTQAEVDRYVERLNTWGRWGLDGQLGTLHLITPATRAAATGLARRGRMVSLARDLAPPPALDDHLRSPLARAGSRAAIDGVGLIVALPRRGTGATGSPVTPVALL